MLVVHTYGALISYRLLVVTKSIQFRSAETCELFLNNDTLLYAMADDGGQAIKRYTKIPVAALGTSCRMMLSRHLNPPKYTLSEEGRVQDKEGLAELMGYSYIDSQNFTLKDDYTKVLLYDWSQKQGSTISVLWSYIERLERCDMLQDEVLVKRIRELLMTVGIWYCFNLQFISLNY